MKRREGLVSNSSSTGFIIAYKKGVKCKCCGRGPDDLSDRIESKNDYGNYEVYAKGVEDVKQYIKESWYDDDVEKDTMYKKLDKLSED